MEGSQINKSNQDFQKLEYYRQSDGRRCDWKRYHVLFAGGNKIIQETVQQPWT